MESEWQREKTWWVWVLGLKDNVRVVLSIFLLTSSTIHTNGPEPTIILILWTSIDCAACVPYNLTIIQKVLKEMSPNAATTAFQYSVYKMWKTLITIST